MTFHCREIERATTFLMKQFERGKSVRNRTYHRKQDSQPKCLPVACPYHASQESGNEKDDLYQILPEEIFQWRKK